MKLKRQKSGKLDFHFHNDKRIINKKIDTLTTLFFLSLRGPNKMLIDMVPLSTKKCHVFVFFFPFFNFPFVWE